MENRNQNTKAVVEAGMVSALVVIITLISMYLGLSGPAGVCILPIPITVIYIRQNLKVSLLAVLVCTILVGLFFNPLEAVANTLLFGLIGIVLGYCLKSKFTWAKTYTIFGLAVAIGEFVYTLIYMKLVTGLGIYATADDMIKHTIPIMINGIKSMTMDAQQKNLILESINRIDANLIVKLMPGTLIVMGFIFAYINYKIAAKILKRLKYQTEKTVALTQIYIPNKLGAFMIIIVLIGYILTLKKLLIGGYIFDSSLLVLGITFAVSGMSVTAYFLINKYRLSKSMVIIIIVAAFIFNLYYSFVILGLVDLAMNFRKLDPNPILKK